MFASPIPPQEVGERGGDTVKRQEGQSSCNVDFPTQRDLKRAVGSQSADTRGTREPKYLLRTVMAG